MAHVSPDSAPMKAMSPRASLASVSRPATSCVANNSMSMPLSPEMAAMRCFQRSRGVSRSSPATAAIATATGPVSVGSALPYACSNRSCAQLTTARVRMMIRYKLRKCRVMSPRVGNKQITRSPDGLDPLRMLGVLSQFSAQTRHAYVQHPVDAVVLAVVEAPEKIIARLDLARMRRKMRQQLELVARQLDRQAVEIYGARGEIDRQPPEAQRPGGDLRAGSAAPEQRVDPRQQDSGLDGLDDVIVRSQLQAENMIDIVVARGEDQDRIAVSGPQLPTDREAILSRQAQVENDDIRLALPHELQNAVTPGHGRHPHPMGLQIAAHELCESQVILDQQH